MSADQTDRVAVDRQAAADMYSVGFDTIKKAVDTGALPAKRNGNRYLILTADLAVWFDSLPPAVEPLDD